MVDDYLASAKCCDLAHEGNYVRLGLYDPCCRTLKFGTVMDVNYDISSDYVQRQTDHGIVVLSIIGVFWTASPGTLQSWY